MIDWNERAARALAAIDKLTVSVDAADEAAAALGWSDVQAKLDAVKQAIEAHIGGAEE